MERLEQIRSALMCVHPIELKDIKRLAKVPLPHQTGLKRMTSNLMAQK
jgi:hypothetical protein